MALALGDLAGSTWMDLVGNGLHDSIIILRCFRLDDPQIYVLRVCYLVLVKDVVLDCSSNTVAVR